MKSTVEEPLILTKIVAENLFGRYNYILDLSPNNDLTIIFGLNGTGKTTILRSIENFSKLRFHKIIEEKFDKLIFYFNRNNQYDVHLIEIIFSNNNISREQKCFIVDINIDSISVAHIELTLDQYELLYQRFRKIKKGEDISKSLDGIYDDISLKDLMELENLTEEDLKYEMDIETEKLWDGIIEHNDKNHLILLFKIALSFSSLYISSMRLTVNSLTSLNQSIEKSKPFYYDLDEDVDYKKIEKVEYEEEIQLELNTLKDLLFVEAVKEISNKLETALQLKVLTYRYVKIFQEKINHFLKYSEKKLECNISNGIIVKDSKTYHKIPIEKLSSGENNLIIIFYHILFETDENTLVMIDEPEISLHIDWQFDFIDKILEIQRELKQKKPLMFLIATHSPQILSDHQDRAIDLKL